MKFLLNLDGPVQRFFGRVGDFILLNLLWLLCSLPIVTIGASTTALIRTTMFLAQGHDTHLVGRFFESFKMNFKQSTIAWFITVAVGLFLYYDLLVIRLNFKDNVVILVAFGMLVVIGLIIGFYLFALIARFDNPLKVHFKNALFIGLANLKVSLPVIAITAAIVIALFFSLSSLLLALYLCLCCGVSVIIYLFSTIWLKVFAKYENMEKTAY